MSRLWILGAADPEIQAIEALLRECGETVAYATDEVGCRVTPRNMYRATHVDTPDADPIVDPTAHECYLVECAVDLLSGTVIDHHRPGDPGHGRPPAEFLPASSLGQVIAELAKLGRLPLGWRGLSLDEGDTRPRGDIFVRGGHPDQPWYPARWVVCDQAEGDTGGDWGADSGEAVDIPLHLVLTAAADHCLGAAYRGECPGVDPDALMRFRAEQRAAFQDRPVEDILADINATQAALQNAPHIELREPWILYTCSLGLRDMRREAAEGGPWPELPEAATRLGIGYVSGPLMGPDGRRKFTCSGTPEQVELWMRCMTSRGPHSSRPPLEDVYGDPARGFAGGYEAEK